MQYVGKVLSTVSDFYRDLNPATLSGAVDIIVVKQKSNELKCSPFHVRFGKLQLLRPSDKAVDVIVNDKKADFCMKLGESGEAFFVLETEDYIPSDVQTSPLPSPSLSAADFDVPQYYDLIDAKGKPDLEDDSPRQHVHIDRSESLNSEKIDAFDIPGSSRLSSSLENINRPFIDDTQLQNKFYKHRRPLSVSSDTQLGLTETLMDIDPLEQHAPDQLHDEWDWGVSIKDTKANSQAKPKAKPAPSSLSPQKYSSKEKESKQDTVLSSVLPSNLDISRDIALLFGPDSNTPIKVSLCSIDTIKSCDTLEERLRVFQEKLVSQEQFTTDPSSVMQDENAVYMMNGNYYQKNELSNLILSWLLFQKIPSNDDKPSTANADENSGMADTSANHNLDPESDLGTKVDATGNNTSQSQRSAGLKTDELTPRTPQNSEGSWRWWRSSTNVSKKSGVPSEQPDSFSTHPSPSALKKSNTELTAETSSSVVTPKKTLDPSATNITKKQDKYFAKTLRLTSSQLESLDLKMGENKVVFRIQSGRGYCEASIFLYNHDSQIVISDIDGTITKSDALGHLFNMVGRDWTHTGVANLYTEINKNQYEFLYLTSRAIGQADTTREYLKNVKQGPFTLPKGPLLLSPDRLFASFHREIIKRKPHEFKMACLRDIKNLFENDTPFYAGFGNRITDAMSYVSVNVPPSRICTIDPNGDVKFALLLNYKSSYTKMGDLVDMIFPPLKTKIDSDFNDFSFWRSPLPILDDELDLSFLDNPAEQQDKKSKKKNLTKHPTELKLTKSANIDSRPRRAYTISNKPTSSQIIDRYAADTLYRPSLQNHKVSSNLAFASASDRDTYNIPPISPASSGGTHSDFTSQNISNSVAVTPTKPTVSRSAGALLHSPSAESSLLSTHAHTQLDSTLASYSNDSSTLHSKSVNSTSFITGAENASLEPVRWIQAADEAYSQYKALDIEDPNTPAEMSAKNHPKTTHPISKSVEPGLGVTYDHPETFAHSLPNINHLSMREGSGVSYDDEVKKYSEKNNNSFLEYKYSLDDEDDIDSMSSLSDKIDLNDFPYL